MEDVLAGVKAYYEAVLAAELAAIGTERGVTVPAWKVLTTSENLDRQYPAIEILPMRINYVYETEPHETHQVAVIVSQAGSETAAVQADLMRYVEAIRRVTHEDDTYGNRFAWVEIDEVDFTEMMESQESGQLLQLVGIQLSVQVVH